MDITDVRKALKAAYDKATQDPEYCGKLNEAYTEVCYPNYWHDEENHRFYEPFQLMVYSYALGPSRAHYFIKSNEDEQVNYYTWHCKDIFATAVQVINEWLDNYHEDIQEDDGYAARQNPERKEQP